MIRLYDLFRMPEIEKAQRFIMALQDGPAKDGAG